MTTPTVALLFALVLMNALLAILAAINGRKFQALCSTLVASFVLYVALTT